MLGEKQAYGSSNILDTIQIYIVSPKILWVSSYINIETHMLTS